MSLNLTARNKETTQKKNIEAPKILIYGVNIDIKQLKNYKAYSILNSPIL